MKNREAGFTLIENAILLVIIGLLLGGVLKGQELITGARVRNIVQQQDGIKAAYFGFLDRYRALPGDYANAVATITGVAATAGCNNGNGDGDGQIEIANHENLLAWEHLSKAGFINGSYTCAAAVAAATSPVNPYGQYLDMVDDSSYAGAGGVTRHNVKTGGSIPSDLLAEIDRKVDDGNSITGSYRGMVGLTDDTACYSAAGVWVSTPGGPNCGGVMLY
jgi:hypothetical protein